MCSLRWSTRVAVYSLDALIPIGRFASDSLRNVTENEHLKVGSDFKIDVFF